MFDRLGLDLPTAVRIFLKKAVLENGVPFELKDTPKMSVKGLEIMTAINDKAINDGVAGMTEEEIETEIAAARAKK